jgi:hypothetical protein
MQPSQFAPGVGMKNLNYGRILVFAGLLSLLLVYIFLWSFMMADPKARSGSDFSGFYTYGRIFETRGVEFISDIDEQKKVQSEIAGYEVVPIVYTHLPVNAPLAAMLVDEDYVASFKRWAIILLLLNTLNIHLLIKWIDVRPFDRENLVILCMGAFLFFPTFSGFMNGREDGIVLLGMILWGWGVFSGKYFLAGLALSLTATRPHIALFLAIPFFFRHRNVFWGFVLGSSVLAALNIALVGIDGAFNYAESIRYIENTVWYESHSFDMPTISGIVRRNLSFNDMGPVKTAIWACYLLGIVLFCWYWHKSRDLDEKHIGLISIAAIFLLPYAHYHDLILLLIPIFCLIRLVQKQKGNMIPSYSLFVLPLVVSLLAAAGFAGSGQMKFPIVYGIMFVLAWLLLRPEKFFRNTSSPAS